jgi:radical SAM protein with 4Fe4S-binding SPASM domain
MHLHYGMLLRVERICSATHADYVVGYRWTRITAFASLDGGISDAQREADWLDHEIARDEGCRNCAVLPICFGDCTHKWQEEEPNEVICTRLRYNARELLSIAPTGLRLPRKRRGVPPDHRL